MQQKHILIWVVSLCIVYNQMYFTGKSKDMVRHIKLLHIEIKYSHCCKSNK